MPRRARSWKPCSPTPCSASAARSRTIWAASASPRPNGAAAGSSASPAARALGGALRTRGAGRRQVQFPRDGGGGEGEMGFWRRLDAAIAFACALLAALPPVAFAADNHREAVLRLVSLGAALREQARAVEEKGML